MNTLPAEFVEQIEDARFAAEYVTTTSDDVEFVDEGAFFHLLGFCDDAPELGFDNELS